MHLLVFKKFNVDSLSSYGYIIWYISNSNSFWGYVIFNSFNNAYREKYDILDQIYINQISEDFYLDDLKFSLQENTYPHWKSTKNQCYKLLSAVFLLI